jgi:hypothetical protein
MDKDVAREVIATVFRCGDELQKLLRLLKERCSPADYKDYARHVTTAIDDIDNALLEKVLAQFPELKGEIEAKLARSGNAMPGGY